MTKTCLYFLYKTTNLINGKFYIGVHQTTDMEDGYIGSGKRLRYAVSKYGKENFKREVVQFFETAEEMYIAEQGIVTEDFLKRDDVYNLCSGGKGGFQYINTQDDILQKRNLKVSLSRDNTKRLQSLQRTKETEQYRKKMSQSLKEVCKRRGGGPFKGKLHTFDTKLLIGTKNSVKMSGKGNSQYGTCWITDGVNNRKIKTSDSVPDGWYKGRT